ncbi:hypothetical protein BUALT_Bualt02G0139900 [Buddleja alternifolia]|uniref:Uncharacterized protein n=1 Tax=Buddleja alternifolia TaxID=168488 RepID=A0AAV6Y1M6_9LAMI|nr:hypothetical protein BUALT_Bualt02G0139900 [Buddleja alternifolia]
MIGKRVFGVAGSPRLYSYGADYGWGSVKKYEVVSIDSDGSISLGKSRELKGSLEIGLSMTKVKMDALAAIFDQGLTEVELALFNSHLSVPILETRE